MISTAASNLRMSMSPGVRLLAWAKTGDPLAHSPAPMVPAPTASPVRKKERRLVAAPDCRDLVAMVSPF